MKMFIHFHKRPSQAADQIMYTTMQLAHSASFLNCTTPERRGETGPHELRAAEPQEGPSRLKRLRRSNSEGRESS